MRLPRITRAFVIVAIMVVAFLAAGVEARHSWDATAKGHEVTVESYITISYSLEGGETRMYGDYCSHDTVLDGGTHCYAITRTVDYTLAERVVHAAVFAGICIVLGAVIVYLMFYRRPATIEAKASQG